MNRAELKESCRLHKLASASHLRVAAWFSGGIKNDLILKRVSTTLVSPATRRQKMMSEKQSDLGRIAEETINQELREDGFPITRPQSWAGLRVSTSRANINQTSTRSVSLLTNGLPLLPRRSRKILHQIILLSRSRRRCTRNCPRNLVRREGQ